MTNSRWEWKTVNLINIQAKVCFKNGLMSEVWCMKKCWNSSTWKRRKSNILCNFPIIFPVLYSCWKNAKKKKMANLFFFLFFLFNQISNIMNFLFDEYQWHWQSSYDLDKTFSDIYNISTKLLHKCQDWRFEDKNLF